MGELLFGIDGVGVAPTDTRPLHIPGADQVVQDRLRRALGDADAIGDLADAHVRLLGDSQQHLPVVGQQEERRGSV